MEKLIDMAGAVEGFLERSKFHCQSRYPLSPTFGATESRPSKPHLFARGRFEGLLALWGARPGLIFDLLVLPLPKWQPSPIPDHPLASCTSPPIITHRSSWSLFVLLVTLHHQPLLLYSPFPSSTHLLPNRTFLSTAIELHNSFSRASPSPFLHATESGISWPIATAAAICAIPDTCIPRASCAQFHSATQPNQSFPTSKNFFAAPFHKTLQTASCANI